MESRSMSLPDLPPLNVVMIVVDDLRQQMGCYGDPDAVTPHMDALAAGGTTFMRAYCAQAVCNPSRVSVMTGRRPDTLRVWDLQTHFRTHSPSVVTLPQHFMQHGYLAECIGKIYHDPRSHRDRPSWSTEETLAFTNEIGGKYVLPENTRRYNPSKGVQKVVATECTDVDDDAYVDGWVAKDAVRRLGELSAQERPFFLGVGFRRPHLPFSAPKKYWDMQHPERIGVVANPLPPIDVPQIALHPWTELRGYSDIPDLGDLTPEQVVHLRHGYYAAMSYADAQIGRVLGELRRTGLDQRTVVCLWGDHGWHLGEHGLWGKTTNFELDTRSPLIFRVPNHDSPGSRAEGLAEFTDIYPTLVDLCGLPPADGVEGLSLAPVLADPTRCVHETALSQFPRPGRMGYSLRTDRWRYTEWIDRDTGEARERELYDHVLDDRETVNLARRAEYQHVTEAMGLQLHAMLDRQVQPWAEIRAGWPEGVTGKGMRS